MDELPSILKKYVKSEEDEEKLKEIIKKEAEKVAKSKEKTENKETEKSSSKSKPRKTTIHIHKPKKSYLRKKKIWKGRTITTGTNYYEIVINESNPISAKGKDWRKKVKEEVMKRVCNIIENKYFTYTPKHTTKNKIVEAFKELIDSGVIVPTDPVGDGFKIVLTGSKKALVENEVIDTIALHIANQFVELMDATGLDDMILKQEHSKEELEKFLENFEEWRATTYNIMYAKVIIDGDEYIIKYHYGGSKLRPIRDFERAVRGDLSKKASTIYTLSPKGVLKWMLNPARTDLRDVDT